MNPSSLESGRKSPPRVFSVYQTPLIFDACERVPGFLRYLSDELPTLTGPLILIGNPDPIPEVLLNSPQFSRICLFPTAWPETESFPPIGEDVSETGTVYEMPAAMAEERTAAGLARTVDLTVLALTVSGLTG